LPGQLRSQCLWPLICEEENAQRVRKQAGQVADGLPGLDLVVQRRVASQKAKGYLGDVPTAKDGGYHAGLGLNASLGQVV
jgi:hypothetical protein